MWSPDGAARALESVVEDIFHALQAGLVISQRIHGMAGWDRAADPHLALQLVRREAVERLRSAYNASAEPSDNLGLSMSGIVLAMPSHHVLRVWHSADGELPPATSHQRMDFYHQEPSAQGGLVPLPPFAADVDEGTSNLAILWNHSGVDITRLDLVRPCGLDGRRGIEDWRVPLLPLFQRVSDIDYREGHAAAASTAAQEAG
jgi:hypothetical protein